MDNNQTRFCPYCGGTITNDAVFCKYCGKELNKEQTAEEKYQASQNQYYQNNQQYAQPVYVQQPVYQPVVSKKNAVMSMIFGIISLNFSAMWIYPIIGWIIGIPSIIFGILAPKKANAYLCEGGIENGFTKAGKITARIGLILTIVMGALSILLLVGIIALALTEGGTDILNDIVMDL